MTDAFISYSRRDKVFIKKLHDALIAANRDVWADWDDIPAASDWDAEIKEGIEKTEVVLFVLSPEWLKSNECRKEFDHALKMGKRLLPILYIMVDPKDVPAELAKINWIYMRETDDFDKALQTLLSAMDTDLDWVKVHTRLQVRALEWDKKNRDNSFTLRGQDLTHGEQFLSTSTGKSPEPTPLQGEYILASRKDATRRQRLTLVGVSVALVVSIALGIIALFQRQIAVTNQQISFVRELSAQAKNNLIGDPELSLLLSLKAVEVTNNAGQSMMIETYDALRLATQTSRVRHAFKISDQSVPVNAVAFHPSGKQIAAADASGSVAVWDVSALSSSGEIPAAPVFIFKTEDGSSAESLAYSPDGNTLAVGALAGNVIFLNASNGKKLRAIVGAHGGAIRQVEFSADGTLFATSSDDGFAAVWDTKTDKLVSSLSVDGKTPILGLSFSANSSSLVTSNSDAAVVVWNLKDGSPALTLTYLCAIVEDVDISPDGKQIATSELCPPDDLVKFVNLESLSGNIISVPNLHPGDVIPEKTHTENINELVYSPDGAWLATASADDTVVVSSTHDGSTRFVLYDEASVYGVAYSPDGDFIVSGNANGQIKLWDASPIGGYEQGKLTAQPQAITGLAYSPDGKLLATSDRNSKSPTQHVWNILKNSAVKIQSTAPVADLEFSPDGKSVLMGADLPGKCQLMFYDSTSGSEVDSLYDPACVDTNNIFDIAYSVDGKYVAVAEGMTYAAIFELTSGKVVQRFEVSDGFVYTVAFSPDGKTLAAGDERNFVTLWDIASGKKIKSLATHTGWVMSVVFSPDGKHILSGSADGTAILWDVATEEKKFALAGHTAGIRKAIFSSDGKLIATGSDESTVKIWDASDGSLLSTIFTTGASVSGLAFSPDGKTIAAGGSSGNVRFYFVNYDDLLELAKARVTRSLTLKECNLYLHLDQCPAP